MKLDAYVEPFRCAKHYGTNVIVEHPEGKMVLQVWEPTGPPSDQQLNHYGYTPDDWDNNINVPDGWGGEAPIQSVYEICDNHYQSQYEYDLAQEIAYRIRTGNYH